MKDYDHKKIEKKWQNVWTRTKAFRSDDKSKKPKFYGLIEFPFASGEGLHVGHVRSNTAMDIIARKRRAEGFNVLYPIGWDSFGLPTENYAIKTGIHPAIVTKKNTANFRRQLKAIGFSFDWEREVDTSNPKYYKWTQWIFLEMFKRGLAYQAETEVWWCEAMGTVLANEEVVDGKSERGDHSCVKMPLSQWMLAITKYADRLYDDLDTVDYLPRIKTQQKNWIGRSEGAELTFRVKAAGIKLDDLKVFTTRPDTLFGVTYVVVAPEHSLISKIKAEGGVRLVKNLEEVEVYIASSKTKSNIDRSEAKEKTGVELKGVRALNPANGDEVPVWIADYVLADYGTGAVMAVPAHDERDFEFAKIHNLPMRDVIESDNRAEGKAYVGEGKLVNSGRWNGLESEKIKRQIAESVGGTWVSKFKLRDWVFSRQRYWGEPFPIVWVAKDAFDQVLAQKDSAVLKALPEKPVTKKVGDSTLYGLPIIPKYLPVVLPSVKSFAPAGDGKSALGKAEKWIHVWFNVKTGETKSTKSKTGIWIKGTRETDTMPNWAGSSWYYLRYADPKNIKEVGSRTKLSKWLPVDWYNGGMEHTTLHLLYSRFWHKFLYDIKVAPTPEPYAKRTSHGMILGEGGAKMSKSLGNVVNPDDVIKTFGADTLRIYEMFMGPFDEPVVWSTDSIVGSRRFIERVWKLQSKLDKEKSGQIDKNLESLINKTIKKVGEDIEGMRFNTAISTLMILTNELERQEKIQVSVYQILIKLLSPFAPHVAEELWTLCGNKASVHTEPWPEFDESKTTSQSANVAIQIMGKVRAVIEMPNDINETDAIEKAKTNPDVIKWIEGKEIIKVIYVPGKVVNMVVKG